MINHKALFYLIEPKGKWEDHIYYYVCTKRVCEEPDFTLPEWHCQLELWLFAEANLTFWTAFEKWLWRKYSHGPAIHIYIAQIIPSLPALLTEFLATEECKREFGMIKCPHSASGPGGLCKTEDGEIDCEIEGECNDSGLIKRPWLRAQEESCEE